MKATGTMLISGPASLAVQQSTVARPGRYGNEHECTPDYLVPA
jgi:hypothetical protein